MYIYIYRFPSLWVKMLMLVGCMFPQCSGSNFMSVCPHCRMCKTYFRVGTILQRGRLSPYHEGQALTALRNCAGALAELVEVAGSGPFGGQVHPAEKGDNQEIGRSTLKEKPDTIYRRRRRRSRLTHKKPASEKKKDTVVKTRKEEGQGREKEKSKGTEKP